MSCDVNKRKSSRFLNDYQKYQINQKINQIQGTLYQQENVSIEELARVSVYLNAQLYDEVVCERSAGRLCGYPLCSNAPMVLHSIPIHCTPFY